MFLVAFRLYGLPLKADLADAAVFLVPFITASVLLGLAIGELFRRPESSTVALVLTSVPALFLSGIIALALPTTFGIRGFVQIGEVQTLIYGLVAAYLMFRQRRAPAGGA
jgi:hypothetical protein